MSEGKTMSGEASEMSAPESSSNLTSKPLTEPAKITLIV